jgi:hypothetical protein
MHQQMKELPLVEDYGEGFRSRMVEWGGMIVSYEIFPKGTDATPLFKGLPDDMCQGPCAHQNRQWRRRTENWRRLLPPTWARARLRRGHRGSRVQPEGGIPAHDRRREQKHCHDANNEVTFNKSISDEMNIDRVSQRWPTRRKSAVAQ